jgi:hypothetical protein
VAGAQAVLKTSTVRFLRPSPISLKNDAKLRHTLAPLPNDSAYEKHALQNYAKPFASIRSQMLYPVELRAQNLYRSTPAAGRALLYSFPTAVKLPRTDLRNHRSLQTTGIARQMSQKAAWLGAPAIRSQERDFRLTNAPWAIGLHPCVS